ncbi:MAG TPA: alpha-mannosidase [Chthonomonadaceae bacterium]|nr:alpha-mannosidase [Chthonomonadaceae bacterium]
MLKHPELTRQRIEAFLKETLRSRLWHTQVPLEAAVYRPQGDPRDYRDLRIAPAEAARYEYTPVQPGFAWGPVWSDAWFRFTGAVPAEWKGKKVVARLDTGAESIVWDGDNPLQGIDGQHGEILLLERAQGGEPVTLTVQATGMNPSISVHGKPREPASTPFTFRYANLAVYDEELIGLYLDVNVAFGVMNEQPPDSPRFGQLLYALNETINLYDADDPATIPAARQRLAQTYDKPAVPSAHHISAIGHAHIDTAWLWPLERTQYKCLHTFATATRYMDQYPEYKFLCSQAAQYAWVKQMAPRLYARIKEKIQSGQWEVTGSMWVEADCNLSGGESLVRQILHGKNFFKDEFGIETQDLWLPDVFGYAAALPQILKKARIDYFLTQKISWNQINKFPHHTFYWQGIDGTRIFTHFPPADTYNAAMTPQELAYNVRNFREHDRATRSLYVFGYGDGGGGPTVEMLENARRLRNVEGMPTVEIEKSSEFFKKAEADAKDLPIWVGELYLELHRGTYTTQARNKQGNRRSEFLLRDAEFLSVVSPSGLTSYPLDELDRAWKTTLLNQFHDILPGSSVNEVYRDSAQDYAEIARAASEIIAGATQSLADQIGTLSMRRPLLVISNLSYFANEAIEVPLREGEEPAAAVGPDGTAMPVQVNEAEGGRTALFVAKNLPLHGYAVWDLSATSVPPQDIEDTVTVSETHLENGAVRVEFEARTGLITRILDKDSEREVLSETYARDQNGNPVGEPVVSACANQFQLFEDKPLFWDAWDIDVYAFEKHRIVTELDSVEVIENGPVRGAIRFARTLPGGRSRITQTVRLTAGSARLDFVTEVDWHESEKMLKVAFPVAVNSPRATYEIQYGHVERPTHYNTSWDLARFEVCAQKWVDLSEGDYGVALLNNCKYGHDVHGNVLRLTLLRSPKAPDPEADMGRHTFTYALLPHGGDFREGEVVENAYALNSPPTVRAITGNKAGPLPLERSFFEVDNAAVFIEAIKRAEKEEAIIVRLYEAHNTRGLVTLTTTLPVKRAFLADLMETNLAELPLSGGEVVLPILPFEILTVKFLL